MKSLKRRAADLAAAGLAGLLNTLGRLEPLRRLFILTTPLLRIHLTEARGNGKNLTFHTPNEMTLFRAQTLMTKEPETLAWIDAFESGSVFYDIGANVGTYTLYAAVSGKLERVLAFEPDAQNYAVLNRNISLNGLSDKTLAFNLALSEETRIGELHMSTMDQGGANNTFGRAMDHKRQPWKAPFRQGAVSFALDDFIERFSPAFPNHIKIDVDGIEREVLDGAVKTLKDLRVRSVLIEINEELEGSQGIVKLLTGLGFKPDKKPHAEMFEGGEYENYFNYVFTRG